MSERKEWASFGHRIFVKVTGETVIICGSAAQAQQIVREHNSHEGLVEAFQRASDNSINADDGWVHIDEDDFVALLAAIAKATGKGE
jgi:hypothetical protein